MAPSPKKDPTDTENTRALAPRVAALPQRWFGNGIGGYRSFLRNCPV